MTQRVPTHSPAVSTTTSGNAGPDVPFAEAALAAIGGAR